MNARTLAIALVLASFASSFAEPDPQRTTGQAQPARMRDVAPGRLITLIVVARDVLTTVETKDKKVERKSLDKFRTMLPRDGALRIVNESGQVIQVSKTQGTNTAEQELAPGAVLEIGAQDLAIHVQVGEQFGFDYTLMAAHKLEVLTRVGASLIGAADNVNRYQLVNGTIQRADTQGFEANLAGQIYVPFDDEAVLSWKWGGPFNPEHHRFGLMFGIGAKAESELSYQAGICWFLDREAKAVINAGINWRRSETLLFGELGGTADELFVRRVWKPGFFVGVSFNLGND